MAINIVWVGCHSEGIEAFSTLLKNKANITGFITLNDESFAKRSSGSRGYSDICHDYDIPVYYVSTIKNEGSFEIIKTLAPDLLIVLGWSEILPERILDIPTIGTVGAHASLLPCNRGSAPINWALIKGEKQWGNSLMWLDKEVDNGEIIDQVPFAITPYDTCDTLYKKVAKTNTVMLLRLIERLEKKRDTVLHIKNVSDEPLLPRRRPKNGLLNWEQDNLKVYDFIRAVTKPYPGAFSFLSGRKYLIWSASLLADKSEFKPGEIIGAVYSPVDTACGIQVGCKYGSLVIHEIEDEDGNVFSGKSLSDLRLTGTFVSEV